MAKKSDPNPGRRQVLQVLAGSVGAGLAAPRSRGARRTHVHAVPPRSRSGSGGGARRTSSTRTSSRRSRRSPRRSCPARPRREWLRSSTSCWRSTRASGRRDFLAALGAIQAESLSRFGRPWLSLDAAQKTVLLTRRLDRTAVADAPLLDSRRAGPGARAAKRPPTLRDRFELLKEWIATAYYSSEKGMKELGWTGQMVHAGFPGCTHPDGHAPSD